MPEYPDIRIYLERLDALLHGEVLTAVRLGSPFVLRSVDPPLESIIGKPVTGFERIGKQIVFCFPEERFLVVHLMIAGRLRWREPGCLVPKKRGLAAFDFAHGTMLLTEEGSQKRASMQVIAGREKLAGLDRGGLDVFAVSLDQFRSRLQSENHTLKRSLTDPRLFSGIGNAYSDEILHRARLSPVMLTLKMTAPEIERLFDAVRIVLNLWTDRLRAETGEGFPEKVTAFREGMSVHGRFKKPCPDCGTPVQRIRYASNETNYCPKCQTGGKRLADRSLSRLLKKDWPRTIDGTDT